MGDLVDIAGIGRAYIPSSWESALADTTTIKRHDLANGIPLNAIIKDLHLGRNVLTVGSWEDILRLLDDLERRRGELVGSEARSARGRTRRAGKLADPLARVLVAVDARGNSELTPCLHIPHLLEFLGDNRRAAQDHAIVVPAIALRDLLASLQQRHAVSALGTELCAPNTVLQPRQQEVYDLFVERIAALIPSLPRNPICLDMGCGSGALALIMAKTLREPGATIWATDKLPEALATARVNTAWLESLGMISSGVVRVTDGGDLYDPVAGLHFDLIVFNPPWANARPRTRLEIARYDWHQETTRRFLRSTPEHLAENGHLLLFYADNAGPKAVQDIEDTWEATGFRVVETLSRRIRVTRRWEHIYLYDLVIVPRTEDGFT